MHRIILIVLALAVATAGAVMAQVVDYCISVGAATHLRETYALDSQIIETVPANTILKVTYEGARGNWLRIDRNGQTVWMARWVAHSRVNCAGQAVAPAAPAPEAAPVAAPQPSEVDNCCFIGWSCNNDADWVRGFHAYQNNQCTPTGNQPAPVNVAGQSYSFSSHQYGQQPSLGPVTLTPGVWLFEVNTAGYIIVSGLTLSAQSCMTGWLGDHRLQFLFNEGRGQATPAQRRLRIARECSISFDISNSRQPWTFQLRRT